MTTRITVDLTITDDEFRDLFGSDVEQIADGVLARIGSEFYNSDSNPVVPEVLGMVVNGEQIDLGARGERFGCANCGHDVNDHDGTGPCPHDDCQSFSDGHVSPRH